MLTLNQVKLLLELKFGFSENEFELTEKSATISVYFPSKDVFWRRYLHTYDFRKCNSPEYECRIFKQSLRKKYR